MINIYKGVILSLEYLESDKEKVEYLKTMLIAAGRSKIPHESEINYKKLREELLGNDSLKPYIPSIIKTCSNLSHFYDSMKSKKLQYNQRDDIVSQEFNVIETYLSTGLTTPSSTNIYSLSNLQSDLNSYINSAKKITNIYGEFELESKVLGQGGTSMVKGFKFKDNEYAIKFLNENIKDGGSKAFKRFKQAHLNLGTINSPSILPQLHMDKLEVNQQLTVPYIIMPKADKTLKEYVIELKRNVKFEKRDFLNITKNLFKIIEDIHTHKIIHRDIKPENIFLYNGYFVLGDFDIASFDDELYIKLHDTKEGERLANAYCSAPEQFIKGANVTYATDLFALGQIIHWMLTGNYLKGQGSTNYSDEYKIFEQVVIKLLQEKQEYRFQTIQEIKYFFKNSKKPSFEDEIYEFDSFINKYTFDVPERYKLKKFDINIKEIINDLNKTGDITELEYQEGTSNLTFNRLETIDEENMIYRLNGVNLEFKIKTIYFFKHIHNFADTLIIIETNEVSKAIEDKYTHNEQIYFEYKDKLFNEEQLSNGWVMNDDIREQTNGEYKEIQRILDKRLIFIASRKSNILYTNESLINSLCDEYKNNTNDFFSQNYNEKVLDKLKQFKRSKQIILNS